MVGWLEAEQEAKYQLVGFAAHPSVSLVLLLYLVAVCCPMLDIDSISGLDLAVPKDCPTLTFVITPVHLKHTSKFIPYHFSQYAENIKYFVSCFGLYTVACVLCYA